MIKFIRSCLKLLKNQYSLFQRQRKSLFTNESVNSKGEPEPWFTYPCIDYLNNLKLKNKTIFEYGSGNSTLYFEEKGSRIVSVEDNKEWYKKLKSQCWNLNYAEGKDYINQINKYGYSSWDIVIIDGNWRVECAKQAIKYSNFIILDNSDWYPEINTFLIESGYTPFHFWGYGHINEYQWCTSIYRKCGKQ